MAKTIEIFSSTDKGKLYSLSDIEDIQAMLRGIKNRTKDLTNEYEIISKSILEQIERRFDTENDGTWAELTDWTIDIREEHNTWPGLILTEYGDLRDSIGVMSLTANKLEIGTDDPRAYDLDQGAGVMEARPFLHFDGDISYEIGLYLEEKLDSLIREKSSSKNMARNLRQYADRKNFVTARQTSAFDSSVEDVNF